MRIAKKGRRANNEGSISHYADGRWCGRYFLELPLSRHNVRSRSFKPLLRRAELPAIRFHELRHTTAFEFRRSVSGVYSPTGPHKISFTCSWTIMGLLSGPPWQLLATTRVNRYLV